MVVFAHDHIRVEFLPTSLGGFKNGPLKGFVSRIVEKELLAVIAPADDVVNGSGIFDALLAWHTGGLC
jgi:hypothetical protein